MTTSKVGVKGNGDLQVPLGNFFAQMVWPHLPQPTLPASEIPVSRFGKSRSSMTCYQSM